MSKGWYRESRRHSLAAKGIHTTHKTRTPVVPVRTPIKKPMYYHISMLPVSEKIMEPEGYYEKTSNYGLKFWYPTGDSSPIFPISDTKETCFATSVEGALFGICSDGGCKPTTVHVYYTTDNPDVDLRDETVQDFYVIEEVRYRRPVNIEKKCSFRLPQHIIKKIEKCYVDLDGDVFFDQDGGSDVKKEIRTWLERNTDCYK